MWLENADLAILSKPRRASVKEALAFAKENEAWLLKARAAAAPRLTLQARLDENEIFLNGASYKVWLKNTAAKPFEVRDDFEKQIVFVFDYAKPQALQAMLIKQASQSIGARTRQIALANGFDFARISVRSQRGRWASRSSSGTMSFNWRMVFLTPQEQDYIIYHEFAHSKFMDHSASFWIYLGRICDGARRLDSSIKKKTRDIFAIEA